MSYNSRTIELKAVNAVTDLLIQSKRLSPYIQQGDREPIWDGSIHLLNKSQEEQGRIPVQIKGKTRKAIPNKPTFPISITNLNNYKRDGGVLFFVVFIIDNVTYPYVAKLAPVSIKGYIRNAHGKSQVSVKLNPVEKDPIKLEYELLDFYADCKYQTSSAENEILPLEDVLKNKNKITFRISGCKSKEEAHNAMFQKPIYLYAELENNGITTLYPIGDSTYTLYKVYKFEDTVCSNGKVFYNNFDIINKDKEQIITIDDFVVVTLKIENDTRTTVNILFNGDCTWLKKRVHQLDFLKNILECGYFKVGNKTFKVNNIKKKDIEEIEKEFQLWNSAMTLFHKLHVDNEINMGLLSPEDSWWLNWLIKSIVYKRPVQYDGKIDFFIVPQIANYKFLMCAFKETDGKYRVEDFYKTNKDLVYSYSDENRKGKMLMTSLYTAAINFDDISSFANTDYSILIPSYEEASRYNPYITERATNDLLIALNAYDKQTKKDVSLYNALVNLSEWIISNSVDYLPQHIINRYQILKRNRELTSEEKDILFSILEKEDEYDIKVACHLLLENKAMAERYFKKMNEAQQRFFNSLPISFFMNKNN